MKRPEIPATIGSKNSKHLPVPAINKNVETILNRAKRSKTYRLQLAEALLRPEPFFPSIPHLAQSEAVITIQIARRVSADLGLDLSGRDRWALIEDRVIFSLASRSRPMFAAEVKKARSVIAEIQAFLPSKVIQEAFADLDELERHYEARIASLIKSARNGSSEMRKAAKKELESLRRSPRPDRGARGATPGGGRRISEATQRRVATFYLLKRCADRDPVATIVALLKKQNILLSPSKIRECVTIYERAAASRRRPDAFIPPSELPEYWLHLLFPQSPSR
jgi:hypothetical protein